MTAVTCELCPRSCEIPEGAAGDCRVRVNLGGRLRATTYGRPSAVHIDPMEKKPLYHFLPGSPVFSIATAGCNLHCLNCQNWQLSQRGGEEMEQIYLPWRDYDGVGENGALWQRQLHVYHHPFYYIDYTLAESCALQFWLRSRKDQDKAMADYVALCKRGGEAAFSDLVKGADLASPFEPGALPAVVDEAKRFLGL